MTDHARERPLTAGASKIDTAGLTLVVARFLLASEFMTYGVRKSLHPDNIASVIAAHHLPGNLVYLVYPWQFCFGWLCFLAFQTRLAAVALFGFCIIAPSIFWLNSLENLTRDYATAGGFVFLFVFGPGPFSLDAKYGGGGDLITRYFGWIWKDGKLIDRLVLFGRALIALPFLADAVKKIVHLGSEQALFQSSGFPGSFVYGVVVIDIIFGLMLLFGYRAKIAAIVLIIWSLIQAFAIHGIAGFLGLPDAQFSTIIYNWFQKDGGTLSSFYKDIEVAGALLMVLVFGPGRISVDGRSKASI